MNLRRILAIAGIEQKRVLRDRPSLSLMLLLPAVQILLFGFAVRIEPHELPVALIGADARIEAIAETIATDTRLNLTFRASAGDPLVLLRDKGAMIVVSADPEGRLRIDADGANPVAARVALEAIEQRMLEVANTTFPVMLPQFDLHWAFNPSLQSAWVLVPGLGGAIVMIGMLLLGAQSIVREREEGGWEALRLSPLSGAELLVGKLLPYLPIAVAQEGLVLLIGAGLFALPFGFGALALLALTVPFAAAHLAWGLVLSMLAHARLQAMQGAMFLYLPSILLSGFLFPFTAMPDWAQKIGEALPLTHFIRASRGVLLRDEGAAGLWRELPPLLLCTALGLGCALLLWRRGAR